MSAGTYQIYSFFIIVLQPYKEQVAFYVAFAIIGILADKIMRVVLFRDTFKACFCKFLDKRLKGVKIFDRTFFKTFKVSFKLSGIINRVHNLYFIEQFRGITGFCHFAVSRIVHSFTGDPVRSFINSNKIVVFSIIKKELQKCLSLFTSQIDFNSVRTHVRAFKVYTKLKNIMDKDIKDAVYVALSGGLFYYAAKHWLKTDAMAALLVGSAVGKILSYEEVTEKLD